MSTQLASPPPAPRPLEEVNRAARRRMEETGGDPLFLAGWKRALFLHYEVDAGELQAAVPFELDLWEGRQAIVSLVAFTIEKMRPFIGGRWTEWLLAPIATHGFLNVRAYVRHEGEPGIFFMREWLSNRMAVRLGPRTFGLPYRFGTTEYDHRPDEGVLRGEVRGGGRCLRYRATLDDAKLRVAPAGSRDEFLLERYTALTCPAAQTRKRYFHVWHEPWQQAAAQVRIEDDSLLRGIGPWAESARFLGANYSPGVDGVWMGWPRRVAG